MALFGQSTAFGSAAPGAAAGGAFGSTLATAATTNPMKDIALNNCPGKKDTIAPTQLDHLRFSLPSPEMSEIREWLGNWND